MNVMVMVASSQVDCSCFKVVCRKEGGEEEEEETMMCGQCGCCGRVFYKITQHGPLVFPNVKSAARVAASNTSSTPSPVREEHSRYFLAPISAAASLPSLGETKRCDFFLISSIARGSSRRSFFSPTSMIGTSGQRSFASSIH